jgi:hypothetical protein
VVEVKTIEVASVAVAGCRLAVCRAHPPTNKAAHEDLLQEEEAPRLSYKTVQQEVLPEAEVDLRRVVEAPLQGALAAAILQDYSILVLLSSTADCRPSIKL